MAGLPGAVDTMVVCIVEPAYRLASILDKKDEIEAIGQSAEGRWSRVAS